MKEQELKSRIVGIIQLLMQCEVKGESVIRIADCLRQLDYILQAELNVTLEDEQKEDEQKEE